MAPLAFLFASLVSVSANASQSKSSKARVPAPILIAQTTAEIVLENSPVRASLSDASSPDAPGVSLAAELKALEPGQRLFLVLQDLHAHTAPGTLFHLFLDLPEDATPNLKAGDPHLVGNFNFYNAVTPASGASSPHHRAFRSYDITSLLQKLQRQAPLSREATVTIIPGHAIEPGSHPAIGRIEIVLQKGPATTRK